MDCGADMIAERRRIEEEARLTAPASFGRQPGSREAMLAQGLIVAGETSDATRLRGFDRQEAEKMKKEVPTVWATVAIAGFLFIGLLVLAISGLKQAGMEGLRGLSPRHVRELGWSVFTDPGTTGIWFLGMALGAGLCLVGQAIRGYRLGVSIRKVAAKQKPDIVGISAATKFGVLVLAICCPIIGVILGLALQISEDPETKHLGMAAIKAAIIAAVVIIANVIWAAASKIKPAPQKEAPGDDTEDAARALWLVTATAVGLWYRSLR
jgi:hypothetical protein